MAADPVDGLFAGRPEEFVARRDALAKQLKADGDKDLAAEVKALRRPTVAAWAVNQVARSAKRDMAALLQIGDRLRDAHDALAEGRGDKAIREATIERRALVAKLTTAAVALLESGGEAQRDAITNTFDAAVADPDAGLEVRAGRLNKEFEAPSGFGSGLSFATPEPTVARSPRREERRAARQTGRRPTDDDTPTPAPASRSSVIQRPAAREAAKRRRELQRAADDEAAGAKQAAQEAAAARQEVSRLQDLLVTANAKAKAATERAQRAQWANSTAHQLLREAEVDDQVQASRS